MTGIELYSTTAASNNSAVPNGWPEGMAPSGVNDCGRQMMAALRTWYQDAQWTNLGYTHTYVASTQFKISGQDLTTTYSVGRRVRAVGSSTGTIYGTITVSAFSTDTTITISWDSGSLSNETLTVSVGILTLTNTANPSTAPFIDSTAIMKGSADATKLLKIEVDGLTTATTRTWTAPDADLTVVGIATTQTLTNKKLSDSTCTIVDDGDATKQLAFQCSGITTSTTRTVTARNASGTMAFTSDGGNCAQAPVTASATAYTSYTGAHTVPMDDTIPSTSETQAILSATSSFTPTSTSNFIEFTGVVHFSSAQSGEQFFVGIYRDAETNAYAAVSTNNSDNGRLNCLPIFFRIVAPDTSGHTYTLRAGNESGGTFSINGVGGARKFGGVLETYLKVSEVNV